MYKTIKDFIDLQDNGYRYHAGDIFPRNGVSASKKRIEELSTTKNRRHIPLIEIVEETKNAVEISEKKPVGRPRKKKNAE